jgi:trehalose-6-phosphate synthase
MIEFLAELGDQIVISDVSRNDYAKGLKEELLAFKKLRSIISTDERYAHLQDKVALVQIVVPSRENQVGAYEDYKKEIMALAEEINREAGKKVVHQLHTSLERDDLAALYERTDIMSVPSLWDGMNLVAKEYAVKGKRGDMGSTDTRSQKAGVIVLGQNAGAAEEMREEALIVNPQNIGELAFAYLTAITMPVVETIRRRDSLAGVVENHTLADWLDGYLEDFHGVRMRRKITTFS